MPKKNSYRYIKIHNTEKCKTFTVPMEKTFIVTRIDK